MKSCVSLMVNTEQTLTLQSEMRSCVRFLMVCFLYSLNKPRPALQTKVSMIQKYGRNLKIIETRVGLKWVRSEPNPT